MEDKFVLNWSGVIKAGAFMGLVLIGYAVIIYVFNLMTVNIYMASLIGISNLALAFFGLWIFGNVYKKNYVTGLFSWGNAFVTLLLISIVSSVFSSIYSYVFNAYIDPEYQVKMMEELRYMSEELYINMNMPEEKIQEQLERFDANGTGTPIEQLWKGIVYGGVVGGGIISLLVALIIRKKNPIFE